MNKAEDIAVRDFQKIIDDYHEICNEIKKIKESLKPLNSKKSAFEIKITQMLEALGLKNFRGQTGGVTVAEKDYVTQPSADGKAKLIDYLIQSGEIYEVASFNSQSLCNWYKGKLEEDFNFRPPGLGEIKTRKEVRKLK